MNDGSKHTENTSGPADMSAEMTSLIQDAALKSFQMVEEFWEHQPADIRHMLDPLNMAPAFANLTAQIIDKPELVMNAQMNFMTDYLKLLEQAGKYQMGANTASDETSNQPRRDRRFKSEKWTEGPFDFFRQFYLLSSKHIMDAVSAIGDLDERDRQKVSFFTRQYLDALSPSNFLFTNPDVLHATVESHGENLVSGMRNLLEDLERENGMPLIKMTDLEAFTVGENIAITPGKVVYRNELFELIQYSPTTEQVYETPLLVFPPWINKYYILDLSREKSFVRWAVEQGFTIFMVSWVNPDSKLRDYGFDHFVQDGYLEAMKIVQEITGQQSMHTIGYCVAGTFLSLVLAYLKSTGRDKWVRSATFFTAQVDFSDAGELALFTDPKQLEALEKQMATNGFLDKRSMALTFNMLRANDLIWSYAVNNYLLGKEPPAFDLLYWNSDATNLPAQMHRDYLKNMYIENNLVKPGHIKIDGTPIDLSVIETPIYVQAGRQDHIAPPQSVYKITKHVKGPVHFILAGSGHIAGVVNPPAANKYQYWTNDELPETLEQFIDTAQETPGSWWTDWKAWLSKRSGKKIAARHTEDGPYPEICEAPGEYVKVKSH